jgi:hypothetical protein
LLGALWPTLRFPSPLIEPDVPISGIRLSDWFHREAHGEKRVARVVCAAGFLAFAPRHSNLGWVLSLDGVRRLSANHLDLSIFESAPEVRVLSSAGISRQSRRLPRR